MGAMPDIAAIAQGIRAARGLAHKRDIDAIVARLGLADQGGIPVGDDCAAIPDGEGHLLFAIEGFLESFVAADPYFAGYCGLMVNLSDIAAMGGRAIAVVDALWAPDAAQAEPILAGLKDAAAIYGVPIVGGHTNTRAGAGNLAIAILGRAGPNLLTSFDAAPGDDLIAAIDLRGRFREPHPYWDASTGSPPKRLRGDLALLATLAEEGLARAAKDISMAGLVGTALMLLECSRAGARIDLDAIPRPEGIALERWLTAFPSFGYVLSVRPDRTETVLARFQARGIAAAAIGRVDASRVVSVRHGRAGLPLSSPAGGGGREADGGGGAPFQEEALPTPPRSARSPSPRGRGEALNLVRPEPALSHFDEAVVWDFSVSPLIGCAPAERQP